MITVKNRGFLLIEVMVTVIVVSICVMFISRAFTSSFRAAGISNEFICAVLAAEDKSFDIEMGPAAETGQASGTTACMGKSFAWDWQVMPFSEEGPDRGFGDEEIGLEVLRLSLSWPDKNTDRSIDIVTYVNKKEPQNK